MSRIRTCNEKGANREERKGEKQGGRGKGRREEEREGGREENEG